MMLSKLKKNRRKQLWTTCALQLPESLGSRHLSSGPTEVTERHQPARRGRGAVDSSLMLSKSMVHMLQSRPFEWWFGARGTRRPKMPAMHTSPMLLIFCFLGIGRSCRTIDASFTVTGLRQLHCRPVRRWRAAFYRRPRPVSCDQRFFYLIIAHARTTHKLSPFPRRREMITCC